MRSGTFEGRALHPIHIGGVHASKDGDVVRTVLGSCIAVCLRDRFSGIGGMNHFMLPDGDDGQGLSSRFGVHAMELLINQCMRLGAERSRLEAKVFGGGHVLKIAEHANNVPRRNIRFTREFLETERISVVSSDVGGYAAREVLFFTDTGRVLMKRLAETGGDLEETLRNEEKTLRRRVAPAPPQEDDITLF